MPHHLLIVPILQSSHHHYLREREGGRELAAMPHHLLIVPILQSSYHHYLREREGVSRDTTSLANSILCTSVITSSLPETTSAFGNGVPLHN